MTTVVLGSLCLGCHNYNPSNQRTAQCCAVLESLWLYNIDRAVSVLQSSQLEYSLGLRSCSGVYRDS